MQINAPKEPKRQFLNASALIPAMFCIKLALVNACYSTVHKKLVSLDKPRDAKYSIRNFQSNADNQ